MATIFAGVLSVIGMSPRNELRGPRQNTADWYTYIGTCGGGGADAGAAPVQQDGRVGVRSAVIDAGPEGRRGRRGLLPCARAEECSLPGRLDTKACGDAAAVGAPPMPARGGPQPARAAQQGLRPAATRRRVVRRVGLRMQVCR
jgi:hypothetical protein